MTEPVYSLVIPIYNEEETLPALHRRLRDLLGRLDGDAEVLLVDDGSTDGSYAAMAAIHREDPRFKIVHLSRNFGHQVAITAGMDLAAGQAVVILDADLQDPPEVVLEMAARWRDGYDIVHAQRQERAGESWLKLTTASLFYRLLRRVTDVDIPADVGDFRLVDRGVLLAFRSLRERDRFVRGMFGWIGGRQTTVRYLRAERFAGRTKYPWRKMVRLAVDAILSFSNLPLRLVMNLGFLISAVSFVAGMAAVYLKLSGGYVVTGWTSLIVVI